MSVVRLPPGVRPPLDVYINGVPQQPGTDYEVRGDLLVFEKELAQEGRLGFWRWFLGAWGVGTYRKHHSVDVRYTTSDGRALVAENLPVEPSSSSQGG
jgi:hypothetical protein